MRNIKVVYYPVKPVGFKKTIVGSIPENFGECSPEQFRIIMNTVGGFAVDDNRFITHLTGIPLKITKKLAQYHKFVLIEQALELQKHFDADSRFYIPEIKLQDVALVAPKEKLKGVTFHQFMYADSYYSAWLNTIDVEKTDGDIMMRRAVACLYIDQKGFDLDRSMKYADIMRVYYTPRLQAILYNFAMIKMWLSKEFFFLFPAAIPEEEEKEATGKKKTKASGTDWASIFRAVRGDDLINSDKYANLPAMEVFHFLNDKIRKNLEKKK